VRWENYINKNEYSITMNKYLLILMLCATILLIGCTDMYEKGIFENDLSCSKEDVSSCKNKEGCNCVHDQELKKIVIGDEIIVPVEESIMCIQVITYAKNPETNETKQFPNPCVVPEGWEVVEATQIE